MGIKDTAKKKLEKEAKSRLKAKIKRKLIGMCIGIVISLMILLSFLTIIMTVESKFIDIMSNISVSISGFWRWIRDDYWIKLDEEQEFSYIDEATR